MVRILGTECSNETNFVKLKLTYWLKIHPPHGMMTVVSGSFAESTSFWAKHPLPKGGFVVWIFTSQSIPEGTFSEDCGNDESATDDAMILRSAVVCRHGADHHDYLNYLETH
jgi:hypothetical protein